ncbi:MAG: hypothetical protein EPN22_06805 [Nitrospirae bacterium]|nr:MAG: hypothetical protein EPN22_06805 [Nitrospirota bacterium]
MKIEYRQISRPYSFSSPFADAEFAILIYISDMTITAEERELLCDQIVAAGCRYAVCAGYQCEIWHDSVDFAYLKLNNWESEDETLIMTTWHEKESLEDIVFFFLNNTTFDNFTAANMLVVLFGDAKEILENIQTEINKQLTYVNFRIIVPRKA